MKNPTMEEKTVYDNFLGKVNEDDTPSSILDFMDGEIDVSELEVEDNSWKKHWIGMPEFEQEDKKTYKTIYVHFRNEEDYQEFSRLIGQNLSEKTKSIWHPKLDRDANSLKRWIEVDDDIEST